MNVRCRRSGAEWISSSSDGMSLSRAGSAEEEAVPSAAVTAVVVAAAAVLPSSTDSADEGCAPSGVDVRCRGALFKNHEASTGTMVSDTTSDASRAIETVTANGRNS